MARWLLVETGIVISGYGSKNGTWGYEVRDPDTEQRLLWNAGYDSEDKAFKAAVRSCNKVFGKGKWTF